jgi:transcriptional regulator GlxA family with amidase domain
MTIDRVRKLAILIFDEVEVLDFCGPFEVFSVVGQGADGPPPFEVYTVAARPGPVLARNRLSVNPDYSFADCPPPDVLLVPGGYGTRRVRNDPRVIDWIRRAAAGAEMILSVCTGALLLGRAGLLEGLDVTTHHGAFEVLAEEAPTARIRRDWRIADNGRIVLSAGISAGLDMSLHVVARLLGRQRAVATAAYMEYRWQEGDGGPAA